MICLTLQHPFGMVANMVIDTTAPAADSGESTAADVAAGVAALTDVQLTDRFREVELAERRLVTERSLLVAEADRRGLHRTDNHHSLAGWLRAHANWSPPQVTAARRSARLLRGLSEVADALHSGRVGVAQVDELAKVFTNPRCGHLLEASIGLLLDQAQRLSHFEFRVCVRRWETLADLDGAHRDRGNNVESRTATVLAIDGGVHLSASGGTALQAEELARIFEAFMQVEFHRDVEAVREQHGTDAPAHLLPRTDSQRRFDAIAAIFRTANMSDAAPIPAPVTVNVLSDQHTYETALASHGLCDPPDDLPAPDPAQAHCETSGGVPLLPDDIAAAVLDGWVRRVLVNSAGVVTDLGRRTRLFTGAAREAAKLLAASCEYLGCIVPATYAQVDHIAEWERDHGATNPTNAAVGCGRHNRWKHFCLQARRDIHGQMQFQRPDGTWLTPVGRPPPDETDFLPLPG